MEKNGIIEIWGSSDEEELEVCDPFACVIIENPSDCVIIEDPSDCVIIIKDPSDLFNKLSINDKEENADDLYVIAESGEVALRDFSHPRHLCVKFPFITTHESSHSSHCEQCYCYVCDTIAPCEFWSDGVEAHCHATEHDDKWKALRHAG